MKSALCDRHHITKKRGISVLRKQKGLITLDFLFAFVLVFGFTQILFAMALTLTVAEVTQYITFAAARNYTAAHLGQEQQAELANQKWAQLTGNNVMKPLFNNGWFEVSEEPMVGHISRDFIQDYQATPANDYFHGVATVFIARMLDFNIPFWGSTTDEGDGRGSGFSTTLGSYLGREPTYNECNAFNQQRFQAIQNLGSYSGGGGNYVVMSDNGC